MKIAIKSTTKNNNSHGDYHDQDFVLKTKQSIFFGLHDSIL
jgi:hypothetical protein